MTIRSLLGLLLLNAFLLGVGSLLLFGLRGLAAPRQAARLAGLAYMTAVAAVGVILTLELVAGIPFSLVTVLATGAGLALAGLGLGLLRRPRCRGNDPGRGIGWVAAAGIALLVVYLEALLRAARLNPLSAWDAWAFWVPKAKALYFFGGLDEQFFRELPGPTYPPLLPALEATAFEFMGSADVVTLHLQLGAFLAAFLACVGGLLSERVAPPLLWPFLLLAAVAPRVVFRTLDPQADFLLDYFFVTGALLLALWLGDRRRWQLGLATLFLAAAMLTKREGQLFAAAAFAAALVASWRERRRTWPPLMAAALAAGLLALPWRLWFTSRGLSGEAPGLGLLGFVNHLDRALPALRSTLTAAFDYNLWLVSSPLALAAAGLAFAAGARVLAGYAATLYVLVLAGITWALWSFVELALPFSQDESVNPVVRLMASLCLLSAALSPLLLDAVWRSSRPSPAQAAGHQPRGAGKRGPTLLVAAATLPYPLVALAGGLPRFPSPADCSRPAAAGRPIEAVFATFASERQALATHARILRAGFEGTQVRRDECGRVEVVLPGIPSLAVGRALAREARSVGLQVRLEEGR